MTKVTTSKESAKPHADVSSEVKDDSYGRIVLYFAFVTSHGLGKSMQIHRLD